MPRHDCRATRLYVDAPLNGGGEVAIDASRTHYLRNVLRLKAGERVMAFNGRQGEWQTTLADGGKRTLLLRIGGQARAQTPALDLHYLFAPLKHARLDYMVQKAVEMGASRLEPVLTRHTQAARVNLERMRANAIEAAEQCGILTLPEIAAPVALERMLASRDPGRLLAFCDEDAERKDPVAALAAARASDSPSPLAVLVGPEGGFAADERALLLRAPNVVQLALGPRILRAHTAAVAALTLVGAVLGDWR